MFVVSVCQSVCLSVMWPNLASLNKNGWTDQDAVWGEYSWGQRNTALNGDPSPTAKEGDSMQLSPNYFGVLFYVYVICLVVSVPVQSNFTSVETTAEPLRIRLWERLTKEEDLLRRRIKYAWAVINALCCWSNSRPSGSLTRPGPRPIPAAAPEPFVSRPRRDWWAVYAAVLTGHSTQRVSQS